MHVNIYQPVPPLACYCCVLICVLPPPSSINFLFACFVTVSYECVITVGYVPYYDSSYLTPTDTNNRRTSSSQSHLHSPHTEYLPVNNYPRRHNSIGGGATANPPTYDSLSSSTPQSRFHRPTGRKTSLCCLTQQ